MPRTKAFRREEALDRAMTLFWKKGYHATSMQDLVDGMGINRSSMYDTFGDKHSLFLEALATYKKKFGPSDYYLKFHSAVEGIRTLVDDYIKEIISDSDNKGCFILNCTTEFSDEDKEVNKLLRGNLSDFQKLLTSLIAKGQQQSELNDNKDPEELSDFLIAGLQGMRMIALLVSDSKRLKTIGSNLLQGII